MAYKHAKVPAGEKIAIANGKLQRARSARSSRSSRATAPARTSGAPPCACSTRRSQKAYGGKRKIAWMEVLRRREGVQRSSTTGCPTRPSRRSASTSSASRGR